MNSFFTDPYDPMTDGAPLPLDPDGDAALGCLALSGTAIAFFILLCVVALFSSCSPQRIVADERTEHRTLEMLQRMDSLLRVRTVVQQDSTWHETILKQFQSIREKSDTSHVIVQDTAGNVIREKIIINNVRETASATDRHEREVLLYRLEQMDSTVNIMHQQVLRSDSLLRQRQDTVIKEVAKPLSWWQHMQIWLGRLVLVALAVCAGWLVVKWKFRIRKVI